MPQADQDSQGFATTHWSLATQSGGDPSTAPAALLTLCLRYWYPVYSYLRRSGHAAPRAHDLTLMFFQGLMQQERLQAATRHAGFRAFVLTELHRFLAQDPPLTSLSGVLSAPALADMEARLRAEIGTELSPEDLLQRGFAVEVLDAARLRLQREAREAGRLGMFRALERYLGQEPRPGDYDAIARQLAVRPIFVSIAVKRLRQRFRELVDCQMGETLARAEDLQIEREALLKALGDEPP